MATAAAPKMTTRRATGTTLKPSQKARDAAEAELSDDAEARPQKKSKKSRGKKANADIENQPMGDTAAEFQFTTLPANRTSKRAPNVIKLTAKTDGIPRQDKPTAPARVVATQRKPTNPPAPAKRKLSAEAAAELVKMRNPFLSPAQVSRRGANQQGALPGPQSSQVQRGTPRRDTQHPQTPVPARPGQDSSSSSSSSRANYRQSSGTVQAQARPPPNARRPPSVLATSRAEDTAQQPSVQPQRAVSPLEDANDYSARTDFIRYAVSSLTHADTVGEVPRIDKGYHVAALGDVDDEWTDEGEHFEDYVAQPRAHATALAYSSRLNAAIPRVHDFDAEEQEEMDDDPEADLQSGAEEDDNDVGHNDRALQPYSEHDDDPEAGDEDNREITPDQRPHARVADIASDVQQPTDDDAQYPEAQHRDADDEKKVGVRDYEPAAQDILERAMMIYKTRITANNAYPDKLQEKTWAKAAWRHAARALDIKMKADGRSIELIMRNSWGLRGEIKGYARNFVPGAFGFKQVLSTDADGIARNVELARQLLSENTFKYKDPSTRSGLFEGDIIQTIINKTFYKNPSDDGVVHDDVYRPFPVRGVALVLTAVQCAIHEWSTGLHRTVKFDELVYEPEYEIHLRDLLAFEEDSKELKIVSAICGKLAHYGRDHAKAPLTQPRGPSGGLTSDDLARAVAAYRLKLQETETL